MKIFLLGFMGAGKSYVGKALAAKIGFDFYDLDQVIEELTQRSISQIFEQGGEDHFRELEQSALHQFKSNTNAIIALGGGTPCFFDNMDWINANGISVYIKASTEVLFHRLKNEMNHRPLLQNLSAAALPDFLRNKISIRSEFYEQAQIHYLLNDLDQDVIGELCNCIVRLMGKEF